MTSPIKSIIFLTFFVTSSFTREVTYTQPDIYHLHSDLHLINDLSYKNNDSYHVLVEIPTGTRQKWEVGHSSGQLAWEFKDRHPREVKFLAYPGNYGFIPQTRSGDGDPLDVIVLSEGVIRGSLLSVKIIGMLHLQDTNEEDTKIIAITNNKIFTHIETLSDMLLKYPNVIPIIKEWFEGYKGPGKMLFQGYGTAKDAIAHIESSHKKWQKHKF